jgi:hypothetical protein
MPRIKRLKMSEVSGVDYPAHLANGFSVTKSAESPDDTGAAEALEEENAMTDKSLADATPEDIAEVAKAFTAEQKETIAKALGLPTEPAEPVGSPEEQLLKSLAPAAQEVFKSLQAEVTKAREEQAIEKAARLDQEAVAKSREELQHLGIDHVAVAPAIRKFAEANPEAAGVLTTMLKAVNGQAESAALFKELGTAGAGQETDAYAKITGRADELVAAGTVTSKALGIAKALDENPSLFAEYQKAQKENR